MQLPMAPHEGMIDYALLEVLVCIWHLQAVFKLGSLSQHVKAASHTHTCTHAPHTHAHAEHLHAGDGVPRKDRCLVNVVRYMPADVADFCHTRSQLGLPHAGG